MAFFGVVEGLVNATARAEPRTLVSIMNRPSKERSFSLGTARASHRVGMLNVLVGDILKFLARGVFWRFLFLAWARAEGAIIFRPSRREQDAGADRLYPKRWVLSRGRDQAISRRRAARASAGRRCPPFSLTSPFALTNVTARAGLPVSLGVVG